MKLTWEGVISQSSFNKRKVVIHEQEVILCTKKGVKIPEVGQPINLKRVADLRHKSSVSDINKRQTLPSINKWGEHKTLLYLAFL